MPFLLIVHSVSDYHAAWDITKYFIRNIKPRGSFKEPLASEYLFSSLPQRHYCGTGFFAFATFDLLSV